MELIRAVLLCIIVVLVSALIHQNVTLFPKTTATLPHLAQAHSTPEHWLTATTANTTQPTTTTLNTSAEMDPHLSTQHQLPTHGYQSNSSKLSVSYITKWTEPAHTAHLHNGRVTILLWTKWFGKKMWGWWGKRYDSMQQFCPRLASKCEFTTAKKRAEEATAIVWHSADMSHKYHDALMPRIRLGWQVYVFNSHESPAQLKASGKRLDSYKGFFNWTMTYRSSSDVWTPYGTWEYLVANFEAQKQWRVPMHQKNNKIAWLVSGCNKNLPRHKYVRELLVHRTVDVFGQCGEELASCTWDEHGCVGRVVGGYRYYLAFESHLCEDYITEKFWFNALLFAVLPIVMGPDRATYEKVAPPHSFIHVSDFEGPKQLAEYLDHLDSNQTAYEEYFKWHNQIPKNSQQHMQHDNARWCKLCERVLNPIVQHQTYNNIDHWWNGNASHPRCACTLQPTTVLLQV
eukprot:TRINITY_DN67850_c4_g1_i1.p1 TRINITY_DN67850_c4_g1~~TRINITY_DN67850_c4_g1_i1.p1  ORF type:complete len:458 (+),score=38.59 TRINITY_DN67850_c4_g1_i1:88-1461(+)